MLNKNFSKAGFTLLEILIAVLIIGVLSSVALPLYRGAIDKSRWSKLLPPARAVATAQEVAYMSQGGYTANIDDLDISLPEGGDMTYTLYTTANGDDANFIRIASSNLDNVRLARYYKNNEGFEDQLYCEAKNGNERANKLCGKLLKGQELISTEDDYKMYLIEERANEVLCNRMELWWSKNFTNCYLTEEQRCTANSMPYGGGLCGWTDTNGQTINEGGTCEGTSRGTCINSIINSGGECTGNILDACTGSIVNDGGKCIVENGSACNRVTINSGGQCISENSDGCIAAKIYEGGKCVGGSSSGCRDVSIYNGGVCEGSGGQSCYRPNVYDGGKCIGACREGVFHEGAVCEGHGYHSCGGTSAQKGFFEGSECRGYDRGACFGVFRSGSVCHGYTSGSCTNLNNQNAKAVFQEGSRCVAHVAGACNGDYSQGGCCEGGDNCPASAPRC